MKDFSNKLGNDTPHVHVHTWLHACFNCFHRYFRHNNWNIWGDYSCCCMQLSMLLVLF